MNKIATTKISKEGIYTLTKDFHNIKGCEVFNSKTNKFTNRDFYVYIKLEKQLKTDREIKITY